MNIMQNQYCEEIYGWFDKDNQDFYKKVVDTHNNGDIFVEVGCYRGKSTVCMAVNIANSAKQIPFYAVDTWEGSEEHQEGQSFADLDVVNKNLYEVFLKNIKRVENYITPIREFSIEAAKRFTNNSLAFVYLDASHDYENVKNDIDAWYPKIKKNGMLAGHDWQHPDVVKAVTEFAEKNNLDILTWAGTWYIYI
jgi:hypothetical protein